MKKILRPLIGFAASMNAIATVWTFLLIFFITADVCGRVFFNHPLTGTPELVKVSLVALVFLHMPHTLWVGRQIRSDLLSARMKGRLRILLRLLRYVLGACMFAGIVIYSWPHMIDSWMEGTYEGAGSLRVPLAPVRTIVVLGSAMTALLYFIRTLESIKDLIVNLKGGSLWNPSP